MKSTQWPLALALLLTCGNAFAQDDDIEQSEDPFAEGDREGDEEDEEDSEDGGYIDDVKRTFGRSGELVIAAERLVGFAKTSQEVEVEGAPDRSSDVTRTHLLSNAGGPDFLGYSAPRIGFDLFVSEGVSLGLALGYSSDSGPYDFRQVTANGRFGYALMFGKVVGAWARVGVTYQDAEADVPQPASLALLAASGDVQLVVVPTKNVVVLAGPRLDLGIMGKLDPEGGAKVDAKATEVGFSAGFGLFF